MRIILSRKGLGCCRCRGLPASSHACHAFGSRRPLGIVGTGKLWKARFSWSHGGCRVIRNHKSKMDPNMDSHQPKMDPWKGKQVIQHGTSNLRLSFHFFSRPKWHHIWTWKIGFWDFQHASRSSRKYATDMQKGSKSAPQNPKWPMSSSCFYPSYRSEWTINHKPLRHLILNNVASLTENHWINWCTH